MSIYQPIPIDKNRTPLQDFPAATSVLAIYASENSAASSVISVTHDTTSIEIAAVGAPAVMRFVRLAETQASVISAAAGANFQHVIPTGTYRKFALPKETVNVQAGSAVGVNRLYGLYQRVAIKSVGNASVLLTEY